MERPERDPKTGQYIRKELDSDTARAMQKRRWEKPREDTAEAILSEAGYNLDHPAPEALKLLVDIAVSKKGGSVAAMREVLKMTGSQDTTSKPGKPAPGTICPLCSELVMAGFRPDDSQQDDITEFLDRYRGNGGITDV